MNILFLSTWHPDPPDNGSKLRVRHLLAGLTRAHEVDLIAFAFATARPYAGTSALGCRSEHVVELDPFAHNQATTLRTFLSPRPIASQPIAAMTEQVNVRLANSGFDAVIASTEMMAPYAHLAPAGVARILEEHNSMSRWAQERIGQTANPVHASRTWVSWQKARRWEATTYPRFDLVTMVSEADRAATVQAVGARRVRVEVIANGVDCRHNRPGLAQPRPHSLVYNGSLTYSANYDAMRWFLAEIYPRIRAALPTVTLTITGSTQGVDLAGLALDDSVRLTGFVDDVRLPVAEAAVAVAPIRQGGGTRLKILEAMALGVPVIATPKAAEGLDVIGGEHLLLAQEPAAFAAVTVALLQDTAQRSRLAAAARRRVEECYDWTAIAAGFTRLIEETVAAKRRG